MDHEADYFNTVSEARMRLKLGATTTQNLIRSGELRSVKVGGRRLVPESAIREFIAAAQARAAEPDEPAEAATG